MEIGLIGAGLMGFGMGASLLRAGHRLTTIAHRNQPPVERLVALGASEAASIEDIARQSQAIILCLSTSDVVEATLARLRPHLRAGQTIIDTGTSDPASSRRIARDLRQSGIAFADAPLTGGPEQAERGKLGVLCGADEETFRDLAPLFSSFATTVRHFGPPGSGHAAKLVSNYLVTGMVALVADAFATARRSGIDWRSLYEVMLNGSGNSGVLRKMVAPALDGDFDGYRFSIANAAKDIGYYARLADGEGRLTPLAETVAAVFADAVETGHGGRNVSHLLDPALDDVT